MAETPMKPMPFIVGVHRSGTTLLRMMLDSHPELAIPAETHFLIRLLDNTGEWSREAFLQLLTQSRNWVDFSAFAEDFCAEIRAMPEFDLRSGLRLFYATHARMHGKPGYGDKTPRYLTVMTGIQEILPEAHFIHIIRDGRDVALSSRHLWFGPGNDLEAQAHNWVNRITAARAQAEYLPHYLEIRYEHLVTEPEACLEHISAFLQLSPDPAMATYPQRATARMQEWGDHLNPDGSVFASAEQRRAIHHRATQAPDPTRIGAWRSEWTADERHCFERVASPLLNDLGYET